ncbi:unnamed protein product [Onchocerca ochengi]|uniref:Zinc finger C2HC domain-containing protein 1A n=1 Tax=Onchocerca ochengi TaxID=42157 RepID=A0A182E8G4_ONCOC|nr:unnamed protein product [Onchocerca ochengi]
MANLPKENEQVHPCEVCGRSFVKNSLVKHETVCRKMAKAKRKVFDSGKQRATGSDITIDNVVNARKEREMLGGTFPRPKTSWRERHETFVNAVSISKQANYSIDITPKDYVKCKYCGRSFNEAAAERHIPFCKTQQEKKGPMKVQKIKSQPSNMTMARPQADDCHQLSNKSLNRDNKMTSKKNVSHPAISERHLKISSRRSESLQRSRVDNSSDNDRRREMSSSRTRTNSATRPPNKFGGQMSNTSERQRINSL